MIKLLGVKGFKCFDDEIFSLSRLTLLSGLNSSGKSTFLQAIRMLMGYDASLMDLGPLSGLTSSLHKGFSIYLDTEKERYFYRYPKDDDYNRVFDEREYVAYISAARYGPEIYLPSKRVVSSKYTVGEKGEYVLDFLEHHIELGGVPELLQREEVNSNAVRNNLSSWLGMISPGIIFDWETIPKADLSIAEFTGRRPVNVGFGLSYSLPIIANALVYATLMVTGKAKYTLLMIENPEAHLHPAGQTQLGEFLAKVASCGVQVIVETHSDHLLNGIRWAVKNGLVKPSDSTFYYFKYSNADEKSFVKQPIMDKYGYFDEWPEGFFDENEKNLKRIL